VNVTDLPGRIAEKIEVDHHTGCWLWTGSIQTKGYGMVRWGVAVGGKFRTAYVHRVAYHLLVDPTFEVYGGKRGTQIDHQCPAGANRACCNPQHLAPATNRLNSSRSKAIASGWYVGVHARGSSWSPRLWFEGRSLYLGSYSDAAVAAHHFDAACLVVGERPTNYALGLTSRPPTHFEIEAVRARLVRQAAKRRPLGLEAAA
jgi:hypothetical protein